MLVTLAGASPAHGFTLRLADVVAFAQTAGTPLPPMTLNALDYFNVTSSQESVSTVVWDFGTGVVGSSELNGELYDVVTGNDAFRMEFLDMGNPRTQIGTQGSLFMRRSSNPAEIFNYTYSNAFFEIVDDYVASFDTDVGSTLTLIAGMGTPQDFTPNGNEWENSAMVSQSVEEAVVPEPGSAALLAAGLAAGCLMRALTRQRLRD